MIHREGANVTINPEAAARRERSRESDGKFGHQQHSAPEMSVRADSSVDNPMGWDAEQIEASSYEAPLVLNGLRPEDLDEIGGLGFGSEFRAACGWAHSRGDRPEDIRQVRKFAGQMSDESFRHLYHAIIEAGETHGDDHKSLWLEYDRIGAEATAAYTGDQTDPVADDYMASSGTSSEGYMGGSEFTGHLYRETRSLSDTEVAKRIRDDIKAAKQAGYIPKNVRVSVRNNRGYSGFTVTAKMPGSTLYETAQRPWLPINKYNGNPWRTRKSRPAAIVSQRLEAVTNRYGYSDINSMVDYHNSYRRSRVSLEASDESRPDYAAAAEKYERWRAAGFPDWMDEDRHGVAAPDS